MKPGNLLCRLLPTWFTPAWDTCTLASCWSGGNASFRHMNAFGMDDAKFKASVKFQLDRGCNTVHLIVTNQGDGGNAGYSPYGAGVSWTLDKAACKRMRERMAYCRRRGLGVVLWLLTDDSGAWVRELSGNWPRYCDDVKRAGLLRYASTVVLALEANEYLSATQIASLARACRDVWRGMVGVHQTSGQMSYSGVGDVFFAQVQPGTSHAAIASFVQRCKAATGKPVNMFEMERGPDRDRSQAALKAGAFAVGNW